MVREHPSRVYRFFFPLVQKTQFDWPISRRCCWDFVFLSLMFALTDTIKSILPLSLVSFAADAHNFCLSSRTHTCTHTHTSTLFAPATLTIDGPYWRKALIVVVMTSPGTTFYELFATLWLLAEGFQRFDGERVM